MMYILLVWLVSRYNCPTALDDHPEGKGPSTTKSPLRGYINHIIQNYQDLLQDEVIPYQTSSWNFVLGYETMDEKEIGACPRVYERSLEGGEKQQERLLRSVNIPPKTLPPDGESSTKSDFIWDDEDDIGGYLDTLIRNCKKVADGEEFGTQCWGYLKDLIYEPRCTMRFDSRKVCKQGDASVPEKQDLLEEMTLDQRHFRQDSLNVVIIGAGPVGLFLANALTELDRMRNAKRSTWYPHITVTILENRVEQQGVKLPYTRNWQTLPEIAEFINVVDERVSSFFNSISNNELFAMPLNAIEALLYLSNRDRGVKFVFDNTYEDSLSLLEQRVPNLMVFDATGHRLDTLVRGHNCQKSNAEEHVKKWQPNNNWEWFGKSTWRTLQHYQHVVDVAQQGDIMYPVTSDGLPYSSWWLHINDVPHSKSFYDLHGFWEKTPASSSSKLCISCRDLEEQGSGGSTCEKFCQTNGFFSSMPYFREDIKKFNLEDQKQKNQSVWFAKRGADINLTGKQAQEINRIIREYGYETATEGMPLIEFPFKKMSTLDCFLSNGVLDAMIGMSRQATKDQPTITLFQHRPYAYKRALVSSSSLFKDAPLLRIGDSLLTGDPTRSSGLVTHLWVIRALMCRIRGEEDDCHEVETEETEEVESTNAVRAVDDNDEETRPPRSSRF